MEDFRDGLRTVLEGLGGAALLIVVVLVVGGAVLGVLRLFGVDTESTESVPTTETTKPRPVGWYEGFCAGDGRSRYSCGVGLVDEWCVYVSQAPYEYESCNANTTPAEAWTGRGWTPPSYDFTQQAYEYVRGALPCVEELGAGYLCEPKVTAEPVPF